MLEIPLGLDPSPSIPTDNPLTVEKVALGKMLFFDKRLSRDGTVACATCHDPGRCFSNGAQVATGVGGRKGERNVPVIFNRAYSRMQFWDGRVPSLEAQVFVPITDAREMGSKVADVLRTINAIDGYRVRFQDVFGGPATARSVAQAIAAFERTLLSGDAPYDRYLAGDTHAMSAGAVRGMRLFFGRFKCNLCHSGRNFTNEQLTPRCYPAVSGPRAAPHGAIRELYKTPTLRNVALSAPYLHDGRLSTLEEVMDFYDGSGPAPAGTANRQAFPIVRISAAEKRDLVLFLKSLTGTPIQLQAPTLP